ncbi:MAG: aminodeoxychorismate synthase component I [Planctomycetota bacterium]
MFCLEIDLSLPLEEILESFAEEKHSAILLSGGSLPGISECSFAAVRPFLTVSAKGTNITITRPGKPDENFNGNPLDVLDELLMTYKTSAPKEILRKGSPPPFLCGAIGYFGYGLRTVIEKVPANTKDDLQLPDMFFAFYDNVIHYDSKLKRATIFSVDFENTNDKSNSEKEHEKAEKLADEILSKKSSKNKIVEFDSEAPELISDFTYEEYIQAVEKVKQYILAGDIYQVNLSQRFTAKTAKSPYDLFKILAKNNPEPFAAYINLGDAQIVSTSPERFLKVSDRYVETRPIKGTRPRGKSPGEDEQLREELIKSKKDEAELSMIVDLERNDLGKICEFGSVIVREHKKLEAHPPVFHLISIIEGFLKKEVTIGRLIKATFPGGSITGAPKIRAMEIIDELERHARNVYTGSIGYIGFDNTADLNIAIRTMVIKNGIAYFNVGGGIVADSQPSAEYKETLHKAKALIKSLSPNIW